MPGQTAFDKARDPQKLLCHGLSVSTDFEAAFITAKWYQALTASFTDPSLLQAAVSGPHLVHRKIEVRVTAIDPGIFVAPSFWHPTTLKRIPPSTRATCYQPRVPAEPVLWKCMMVTQWFVNRNSTSSMHLPSIQTRHGVLNRCSSALYRLSLPPRRLIDAQNSTAFGVKHGYSF